MLNFPTPHCHPQSFDSASTPEAFAQRELELNTGALTVTDHGTMGACRRVYDLAKAKKLTPVLGLEAYFRDDDCPILKAHGIAEPAKYLKYYHITIHCLDAKAFSKLSWKLSHARIERHGSETKPIFNWADLEEIGLENVTFTSGCLVGMVQRHILREGLELPDRFKIAKAYYEKLRSLVRPGNWFVEVFPHRCDKNWVAGVFLTGVDGTKLKYWEEKNLKLEHAGEIKAAQLAKLFGTDKWVPNDKLVAVMNNRKWSDLSAPMTVEKVEHLEDFIPNECQPWCPDGDVQVGCNRVVQMLAKQFGDKILISDDSHYAHPDEKIVQDIRLRQMGNWRFYGSYHRQSSEEAFAYFNTHMGVDERTFGTWVENNHEWAAKFKDFTLDNQPSLPTKFYPSETLQHTMELIKKHGRMQWDTPMYTQRLEAEINLLHRNGIIDLLPYFFIDEDVCSFYESIGKLTGPGRGSAAGILLTYLLGITHADPLKYNLSMERFLTMDRIKSGKLPDIDQDLPTRDPLVGFENPDGTRVKGWLDERFGDHFAQISVDTTLKLKSSVKDVSRVVHEGRVPDIVENLAKKFQLPPQGVSDRDFVFGYNANGTWEPGSLEYDQALKEYVKLFPKEWAIVQKCLGLARQKSRHACAYVIANRPVAEFIPLMDISGYRVTQYTAPSVEASGGLKMDFLVINSLNDIQDAIKIIQSRSGVETPKEMTINNRRVPGIRLVPQNGVFHDIWDLPEDQAVFRDVAEGKTETVFQFNTSGAIQWLRHFNCWKNERQGRKAIDSIEAMSAFTALDRPGPLDAFVTAPDGTQHNMLVEYARRARGEDPVGTLPIFQELLPETYGVMVYQEQLQRMYQALTGCSGPEAEEFRSNVAKKKMEKVLKAYGPWMERVGAKFGKEEAQGIWDFFVSWGQYGFNKSHSVCYSIIGYACAYLKHHFPLEWWCAVLRNADKNEINETFWRHCGHLIDLPDLAKSGEKFEIVGNRIQAPLSLLQGVGETAHKQIMDNRPYGCLRDFCQRIEDHCVKNSKPVKDKDGNQVYVEKGRKGAKVKLLKMKRGHNSVNRGVVYRLIASGALDSFFPREVELQVAEGAPPVKVPFDLNDKFLAYERTMAEVQGKRPDKVSVKEDYRDLNAFERYQVKKAVLPAYSQRLLPMFVETNTPGVFTKKENGRTTAWVFWGEGTIPFMSPSAIAQLDAVTPFPEGKKLWAAIAGYVISQRVFSYKNRDSKTVEACELVIDVDGVHMKFVKWPDKEGNLDPVFKLKLAGAVVVGALSKYTEDRPFGIEGLIVVQVPLGEDSPERSPSTESEEEAA